MGGNLSKISRKGSKGERGEKGDTPNIEFMYDNITGELSFRSNGIMVTSDYIKSRNIITKDNIVDNTILEIVFKDEYIGDKTSQEICNACKAKKKIIGKLDNKTLNFSVIECDVNGNVSLKTLIDNETHEFICSSDNKWSKKVVSLVTKEDFNKSKKEQSELIDNIKASINTNATEIDNNKDLISNNEKRIDKNEDDISTNAGKIEENEKFISSHGTAITNINQEVENIGESITGLKTDINTLNGKANNTTSELNGVKNSVTNVAKDVDAAQKNIGGIQSIVQKNLQSITNLQVNKLDKTIWDEFIASGGGGAYDENVLTVDDVAQTLSDDDIYLEGHRTVPSAEAVKKYVQDKVDIVDLGTFAYEFDGDTGETIKDQTQEYEDAIDSAIKTGIYKIAWAEAGMVDTSIIIVNSGVIAGPDYVLQIKITPDVFSPGVIDDPWDHKLIFTRFYYDGQWSDWEEPFELSQRKRDEITDWDDGNHYDYPTVGAVVQYVNSKLHPTPIAEEPSVLEPNNEYHFGLLDSLHLRFPSVANAGDVIYINFFAEASDGNSLNLVIDTTNTSDIELVPENATGYEIFAKYIKDDLGTFLGDYWVVNYSEYTKVG